MRWERLKVGKMADPTGANDVAFDLGGSSELGEPVVQSRTARARERWADLPERNRKTRWDIQGLRAFAVMAVVADHLTDWPKGGFVGVDIFFVISGFLITSLLVREGMRSGHISFIGFYRRRILRIIPAATVVLLATWVASRLLLNAVRVKEIGTDALWAFGFGANWHFRDIGTDYFNATAAVSPLQHFWSLSIEEQFYFGWPWLMLLILLVLGGLSDRNLRMVFFVGIALVTVASFVWALHETSTSPTGAYFSTFSRAWELGAGAALAIAAPLAHKIPDAVRPVLAWIGLAAMTTSLFLVSSDNGFPAPWAALPVAATALVIAAGTHQDRAWQQPAFGILTNRVSNYVGDISYSLYLWHFPVIILGFAQYGESTSTKVLLAFLMAMLAVFAYHLVEDPIRQSTLLEPWTKTHRERRFDDLFPRSATRHYSAFAQAFVAVVAVAAVVLVLKPVKAPQVDADLEARVRAAATATAAPGVVEDPVLDAWQAKVRTALLATTWPKLKPDADSLDSKDMAPEWVTDHCLADPPSLSTTPFSDPDKCIYGDAAAPRRALLIGDSLAISWMPAIRRALAKGWSIQVWAAQQCPIAPVAVKKGNDNSPYPECRDIQRKQDQAIAEIKPDLLIMGSVAAIPIKATPEEVRTKELARITELAKSSGHVLLLGSPQTGAPIATCKGANDPPTKCINEIKDWHLQALELLQNAAQAGPNLKFVNPDPWLCVTGAGCPAFIDGTPVFADGFHYTAAMSKKLAPLLKTQINELLNQGRAAAQG